MFSKSPSPALGEGLGDEGGLSFVSQSALLEVAETGKKINSFKAWRDLAPADQKSLQRLAI
jgi:hypothetical protein